MRIAVAGATGVVGRYVAEAARDRGHEVVELTRSAGVDLTSASVAEVLAERLEGVAAVVDTTNIPTLRRGAVEAFFGSVTRHLLAGEQAAGVGHHVALSVVGVDDIGTGHYAGKRVQEQLVVTGSVPWSILRATQFYEFAEQVLGFMRLGPFSLVPQMLSQPVAACEVGAALVDVVEAGPSGRVPELAGPEWWEMVDLARRVSQERALGRRVIGVRLPGAAGRAMRAGALTPVGDGPRGSMTLGEWLARG